MNYNCASPAVMYNGMIYPIRNYTLKGFIWYQGETNSGFPQYHAEARRHGEGLERPLGTGRDAVLRG